MARMRYVKPEFWTDSNMIRLSRDARLFYIGTWNFALCEAGHLADDPVQLKMQIFPADGDVDVAALIEALVTSGRMARLWAPDGRVFLRVGKLSNHQKTETRWSTRCPACQADLSGTPPTSTKLSETLPTSPILYQPLPNSAQEGRGGELKESSAPPPVADATPETDNVLMLVQPTSRQKPVDRFAEEFAAFWEYYPRKDDRKKSAAAYVRARKVATAEQLLEGSKAYAAMVRREGRSKQHMLLGTSWLNGERWNDEIGTPARNVTAVRGPVFEGA